LFTCASTEYSTELEKLHNYYIALCD
jgi:hypothetical protein